MRSVHTQKGEPMSDLIDRQAILKHIENIRQDALMIDDIHRASIIMNGMHLCEEAVRNQPSAQPELIRCKECKHYNAGFECLIEGYGIERDKDWFCRSAERREEDD